MPWTVFGKGVIKDLPKEEEMLITQEQMDAIVAGVDLNLKEESLPEVKEVLLPDMDKEQPLEWTMKWKCDDLQNEILCRIEAHRKSRRFK